MIFLVYGDCIYVKIYWYFGNRKLDRVKFCLKKGVFIKVIINWLIKILI